MQGKSPRRKDWRDNRDSCLVSGNTFHVLSSLHKDVERYEFINDVILDHLDDEIKSTDRSGVWRYLISFKASFNWPCALLKIYFFPRIFYALSRISGLCLSMGSATSAPATSPNRTSSSLYFSQFCPKGLEPSDAPFPEQVCGA